MYYFFTHGQNRSTMLHCYSAHFKYHRTKYERHKTVGTQQPEER